MYDIANVYTTGMGVYSYGYDGATSAKVYNNTVINAGRYAFEEFFSSVPSLSNRYVATTVTVIAGAGLALSGKWSTIWPVFGASNQLLAGLALLSATVWLAHTGRKNWVTFWPMIFMFIVTLYALVLLSWNNFAKGNILLGSVSIILLLLALFMIIDSMSKMKSTAQAK